jgi:hypothetical protein
VLKNPLAKEGGKKKKQFRRKKLGRAEIYRWQKSRSIARDQLIG